MNETLSNFLFFSKPEPFPGSAIEILCKWSQGKWGKLSKPRFSRTFYL